MNTKVVKNAYWIILCRIIQSVLTLFIGMLTARYLGPTNYGKINYAASIVAFVTPIMQLGLDNILVQEFVSNDNKEGEILGTTLLLSFFSAIICMFGVFAFSLISGGNDVETTIVCVLYSTILVFQAIQLCTYWYQAHYLAKYSSVVSLIAYFFVSAYKVLLLLTNKNIYWFAISNALDHMIIALTLLVIYKKKGGQRLVFSMNTARRLLNKSMHYIIPGLMVNIFAQTDKIMIKFMIGTEATGYYSAAVTCASLSAFVFVAIIDSVRPSIFENQKMSNEKFEKSISMLYSVIIYFSLIQCVVIALFADPIIKILYGSEYSAAISALRIIVWYTTFSYLGAVRNIWMLSQQLQKYLVYINLFGALANVLLNYVLISTNGIVGAAIASLITQFFTNVIVGYIIRPISYNNTLMIRGLNPKILLGIINKQAILKYLRRRKNK